MATEEQAPKAKIKLTTSQLLQDLKDGFDRNAIRKKYGMTIAQAKDIFKHPSLANKKVRKDLGANSPFELEDDIPQLADKTISANPAKQKKTATAPAETATATTQQAAPAAQQETAPAAQQSAPAEQAAPAASTTQKEGEW